jgi:hypothetical protein
MSLSLDILNATIGKYELQGINTSKLSKRQLTVLFKYYQIKYNDLPSISASISRYGKNPEHFCLRYIFAMTGAISTNK